MTVDGFDEFADEDLKSYEKFKKILNNFRSYYKLESYDLKQIDKYLWLAGKEYFPKNFGNRAVKKEELISSNILKK